MIVDLFNYTMKVTVSIRSGFPKSGKTSDLCKILLDKILSYFSRSISIIKKNLIKYTNRPKTETGHRKVTIYGYPLKTLKLDFIRL